MMMMIDSFTKYPNIASPMVYEISTSKYNKEIEFPPKLFINK